MRSRRTRQAVIDFAKWVRYALVVIETENQKPQKIIRIQYSYLCFNSKGFLDTQEMDREMRLGINMVPPIMDDGKNSIVINAEHKFAKKSYTERYLWTPSRKLEVAIVDAVFSS